MAFVSFMPGGLRDQGQGIVDSVFIWVRFQPTDNLFLVVSWDVRTSQEAPGNVS